MSRADQLAEDLLDLDRDDPVEVTIDDETYSGVVIENWHEPIEHDGSGVPVPGSLSLGVELDNQTVSTTDVSTHSMEIRAEEKRSGFTDLTAVVYDPDVDEDGYILDELWRELGTVVEVEDPDRPA